MNKHDYQFMVDMGLQPAKGKAQQARNEGVSLDTYYRNNSEHRKLRHKELTYFIQNESGLIKIGRTNNLKVRLRSLQVGNAHTLKVLGVTDIKEREVHKKFVTSKIRGEWYQDSPELQRYIHLNTWAFDD